MKIISIPNKHVESALQHIQVIDDFFDDPEKVREAYLSAFNLLDQRFPQQIVRKKVYTKAIEKETVEKVNNAGIYGKPVQLELLVPQAKFSDKGVGIHFDRGELTGIVYLNPSVPPSAGTSFFYDADKGFINRAAYGDLSFEEYRKIKYEKYAEVDNVFNRMLLFPGIISHAANKYKLPKNNVGNARLIQITKFKLPDEIPETF